MIFGGAARAVKGRCLHDLIDILVLILVGTLSDCDNFVESRLWNRQN